MQMESWATKCSIGASDGDVWLLGKTLQMTFFRAENEKRVIVVERTLRFQKPMIYRPNLKKGVWIKITMFSIVENRRFRTFQQN
jgi:hypothetical protein